MKLPTPDEFEVMTRQEQLLVVASIESRMPAEAIEAAREMSVTHDRNTLKLAVLEVAEAIEQANKN